MEGFAIEMKEKDPCWDFKSQKGTMSWRGPDTSSMTLEGHFQLVKPAKFPLGLYDT